MGDEFEAAGAMATAGLAAGAIEGREAGEAGHGACANCGAQLAGAFCSQCGQNAHPHRSLVHVFEEFLHGVVHFDTKAWRTVPLLLFRPGTLTRNYVYGKRARYISPLAMFLFTIFFMYFVFAVAPPAFDVGANPEVSREELTEGISETEAELEAARAELARVEANPPPDQPEGLAEEMAQLQVTLAEERLENLEQAMEIVDSMAPAEAGEAEEGEAESPYPSAHPPGSWQWALQRIARSDDFVVVQGMPELNERVRYKFENPDLALYKIQQAAYKLSFLLAPLSLPFIALLFLWKRGVTLYDHVVFALYSLSFASILFLLLPFLGQWTWTNWLVTPLLLLGLPVHTFFHLKGAYALGWFSALWRTLFMLVFAIVILIAFILLITILGLVG